MRIHDKIDDKGLLPSFSLYFTGSDINALLVAPHQRKKTLAYFSRLGLKKVYLEFGHQNEQVKEEDMREITRMLSLQGITVATAMVPALNGTPYCYNNAEHMGFLEVQAGFCARISDEIIIDDWLFTTCKCPVCVKERGNRTWAEYRRSLIAGKARTHLLGIAKKANPNVRIIIKYPNWFEGHAVNGYAVEEQIRQFDGFCIGVETRQQDLDLNGQHLPLANAYITAKWYAKCDPDKFYSTWIDNCSSWHHESEYPPQAFLSVLAGVREIILWCAGTHYRYNTWSRITRSRWDPGNPWAGAYRELVRKIPLLRALSKLVRSPSTGIPVYLPYGSSGEYNIYGFLGMAGLPLEPVAEFPCEADSCVLTAHSFSDKFLVEKILGRLENGRDVMMTGALFRLLKGTEIGTAFQPVKMEGSVTGRRFTVHEDKTRTSGPFYSGRDIGFPLMQVTTWPYDNRIALNRRDADYTVLGAAQFLNARIYLLNMPDNQDDLLSMPSQALDSLRRVFYPGLDSRIEGPARVGLYCYQDGTRVLYNMSGRNVRTTLVVPGSGDTEGWKDLLTGRKVRIEKCGGDLRLKISLPSWGIAVVKKG